LNKLTSILGVFFVILNAAFLWVAAKISEFIVSIYRLDETRGYMLTPEEEIEIFITHTIILLLIQSFIILMVITFFKIKKVKNSTILWNLGAYVLLFLICVFNIYQFTIHGY
jgi:hypothetical protein